jgi:MinD superfamily P-loop ATPase
MRTIALASGKGGAGKTSVAAALAAALGPDCVFADCDVDAANGAIALGARIGPGEPYFAGPGYRIEGSACTGCGLCARVCRFDATRPGADGTSFRIVPELCEHCGACVDRCPRGAVESFEKQAGSLFVSETRLGIPLVHAYLEPGEDTSGKLVRRVRERSEAIAKEDTVIVVDCPPGIGCPVIASLTGADLVVAVVEAGASGIRDARRLMELAASMGRRQVALLNKTGLDPDADRRARELPESLGIPVAGAVPFDPALRSAEERGGTWLDVESEAAAPLRDALKAVRAALETTAQGSEPASAEHKEERAS